MPNIKHISDLRNYNEVLRHIDVSEPVFLTKNGHGCYVIVDIDEYEKARDTQTANCTRKRRKKQQRKKLVDRRQNEEKSRNYRCRQRLSCYIRCPLVLPFKEDLKCHVN